MLGLLQASFTNARTETANRTIKTAWDNAKHRWDYTGEWSDIPLDLRLRLG